MGIEMGIANEGIILNPVDGIEIEIDEEGAEIDIGPTKISIKDPRIWKVVGTIGTIAAIISGVYWSMMG